MSVVLALLASALWGGADFLGGTAARRLPATTVVGASQAVAVVGVLVVAAATGAFTASTGYLGWALAGGVLGLVAVTAFYAALAEGTMGVVAPIAALGVIVPVAVGVVAGDRPTPWQGLGVAVAIVGVVLASGPEVRRAGAGTRGGRPVLLAVVAALGFGAIIVCISHGARSSTVMTLLLMRVVTVTLLGAAAIVRRVPPTVQARDWPVLAAIGGGDVGANAAFAVASTRGLLSVVAVLSSLYPAVTVVLARSLHGERMRPVQSAGVGAALVGVVLIASGGSVSA
jgi:drug/metabolite transporter (DMT)-like permease